MIVAVPVRDGRFMSHFGGAEAFALYAIDPQRRTVASCRMAAPPEHGRGVFPVWLRQQGATVVLAGGMGPRASDILGRSGIEVVLGVTGDDPDGLVARYLNGSLVTTGELCHEHGFDDCGHHHDDEA